MRRRARYLDIPDYMTADEASAILHEPRAGFRSAVAELGVLLLVLLGFATAAYAAAAQLGIANL
jgi:hypothetical protein